MNNPGATAVFEEFSRFRVDGDPNIDLDLAFAPDDFRTFDIGTTTCMPAVNAIPAVVAAPAGVLSTTDLPTVAARGVPGPAREPSAAK